MNKNDKNIILYMHAGSGNHGCEAIANSLAYMLKDEVTPVLISYYANEDEKYSLGDLYEIYQERSFNKHKLMHIIYYIYRLFSKDRESFIRYRFGKFLSKKDQSDKYPVAVSIGGDNYCYDVMLNDLFLTNAAFNNQKTRTVLLGCSIEPSVLDNKAIVNDLQKYCLIVARESLTFEALKKIIDNKKLALLPDPAFALNVVETELPDCFCNEAGVVGINISPMIQSNENINGITIENYESMIEHIIRNTTMDVALIPHVVWDRNDDRIPIERLYQKYKTTDRVFKIEDNDCQRLKYIISKCRFFIGARTHSTIAAYSTGVPTLVVGYSVKAKGIAKDIFGTYDNYVIPVQNLTNKDDLVKAFEYIRINEKEIRDRLDIFMPDYITKARLNGQMILDINEQK